MRFVDYLNDCLKNDEFRRYWEEDNPDWRDRVYEERQFPSEATIQEALSILNSEDREEIIKNKWISKANKTGIVTNDIIFFEDNGKCPVKQFLEEIKNQKLKEKTVDNIFRLSMEGRGAREPLSKYVDDGIYELRTKHGSDIDRIFYFFVVGDQIVLTNGYVKKSQNIDLGEFRKAKKYRKIYYGVKQ